MLLKTKIIKIERVVMKPLKNGKVWDMHKPMVKTRRIYSIESLRQTNKVVAKIFSLTALTLVVMLISLPAFSAFEAHIVNVTATLVQIDPPVLTPPGSGVAWNNTSGGSGLLGTVNVVMTDTDSDATHIFYTFGAGIDPNTVPAPVCGQTGPNGGGGAIPTELIQLSLTGDTVIKAIGCDGNTGAAHKSVTNVKTYDFLELDPAVADDYSPIADSFVEEDNATANKGTEDKLKIKSRDSNRNNRAFIRFDFRFPAGTTINSSSLNLFMKKAPDSSRTYQAKKVTSSWTELGITWNTQPTFNSSPTDSVSSGIIDNVWRSWNVLTDVQSFVTTPSTNFGWELNDSAENDAGDKKAEFISRDKTGADEPKRPYLEVNFTAPTATTTHLVVNEVYPIIGNGKGTETSNEWVEIYNPTGSAVDISGWQICDSVSCDAIPAATPVVPSHGFALVANLSTTWSSFWAGTPAAAVKIGVGSTLGSNGLDNGGDRVILKNAALSVVDTMSYGTDTSSFTLPAPKVGISLARIVKGYDTDTALDWILNATPNPGTNPSVNGTEVMRFTDDGVEVAATEADLPPMDTQPIPDPTVVPDPLPVPLVDVTPITPPATDSVTITDTPILPDPTTEVPLADTSATLPDTASPDSSVPVDAPATEDTPVPPTDLNLDQVILPNPDDTIPAIIAEPVDTSGDTPPPPEPTVDPTTPTI